MESNVREDVCYPQPQTLKARLAIANDFTRRFHYPIPMLVDSMANSANTVYAAWPERLYVIEPDKRLSYSGGLGPFNYKPEEVRQLLAKRFPEAAASPAGTTPAK